MLNIKNVRAAADITGRHLTSKWDVVGTDGGKMIYSPKYRRMYLFFGDTFGVDPKNPMKETNWRGSVAGYTSDFDFSRGIRWDGFLLDDQGRAKEIIKKHMSHNDANKEVTKICQGGIEVDGVMYVSYESIRHWGTAGRWDANFSGILKSTDGGETWEDSWNQGYNTPNLSVRMNAKSVTSCMGASAVSMPPSYHVIPHRATISKKYAK